MFRRLRVLAVGVVVVTAATPAVCRAATDAELLAGLHQKVIRAHQENSVALLLEDESPDYVVADRGEVTKPTVAERRALFDAYLGRTTFTEYRDVTEPIVTVSSDGTLGWVLAQVHAAGERSDGEGGTRHVEFTSAWIELYRKRNGRWVRMGNVSNFKE